jgi:O-antigen ligase
VIAIMVYLWVIHSYKLAIGDVAIGSALVAVFITPGRIRIPRPLVYFGVFVGWAAIGMGISQNPQATYDEWVVLVKVWLVIFALFNGVRTAHELRVLVIAWLGLFALYPLRGAYYNQFICHCTPAGRVAWNFVFNNPNDLAALCFLPLGLAALIMLVEKRKLWKNLALAGIMSLTLLIFLTQSRGAMIALILTALWVLLSRRRARDFVVMALAAGVIALLAPDSVWTRLSGLKNASIDKGMSGVDEERSAESRWLIWKVAVAVTKSSPLTGVGLSQYPINHQVTAPTISRLRTIQGRRDAHSTYLRVSAETGIPGLLLYLCICGSTFAYLKKIRTELKPTRPRESQALYMLQLSLAALLISAFFGSFGTFVYAYLHFGAVIVVADVLSREPWPSKVPEYQVGAQPVVASFARNSRLSPRRSY